MGGAIQSFNLNQMLGYVIPEVRVKRITLSGGRGAGSDSGPLRVELSLCAYDLIEDDLISSWFTEAFEEDEDTSPFEKFIKIRIQQVTNAEIDEVLNNKLRWSQTELSKKHSFKQAKKLFVKESTSLLKDHIPVASRGAISKYKKKDNHGNDIIEMPFRKSFTIGARTLLDSSVSRETDPLTLYDPAGQAFLAYYVWTELDVEEMAKSLNADYHWIRNAAKSIPRKVHKELIIENHNTVTWTNVYQLPDGNLWTGQVRRQSGSDTYEDGWVTASPQNRGTPLAVKQVQNTKIRDMRMANRVGHNYVSVMNRRQAAGLSGKPSTHPLTSMEGTAMLATVKNYIKKLAEPEVVSEKRSGVFTSLWTSGDELYNGNFFFGMNWVQFLRENSAYPGLWEISDRTTSELISLARIEQFEIKRRQVDVTSRESNRLGTPYLPRDSNKYEIYDRTLLSTSDHTEQEKKGLKSINDHMCFLKETRIGLSATAGATNVSNPAHIRWFTMTDRDLLLQRNGHYQYSIHFAARDPTLEFIKNAMRDLNIAYYNLSHHLRLALSYIDGKPAYDVYTDSFTRAFVSKFSGRRQANRNAHYWVRGVDTYLSILNKVSGILDMPAFAGASYKMRDALVPALSSYVDPRKGSPEGIQIVLDLISALRNSLNKMTGGTLDTSTNFGSKGWVGLSDHVTTEGITSSIQKKTPKSTSTQKLMNFSHTFDIEYRVSGLRGMGYDYLTNQTLNYVQESIKGAGLRTISARYYKERCNIETKRFFNISDDNFTWHDISAKVPELTLSTKMPALTDTLSSTKYSYLSPAFIFSSPGKASPMGMMTAGNQVGAAPPPPAKLLGGGSPSNKSTTGVQNKPNNMGLVAQAGAGFATVYAMAGSSSPTLAQSQRNTISSQMIQSMYPTAMLNVDAAAFTPSPAKGLKEVAADIAAVQQNPDFENYPVNVESYKDPSLYKDSNLSTEEQQLKAKYANLLSSLNCVMVDPKTEFDAPRFHTNAHPEGFGRERINFGKNQHLLIMPQSPIQKADYKEKIEGHDKDFPVWNSSPPFMPLILMNTNPIPLFAPLMNSYRGYKPGGSKGKISYDSVHQSNFKLLDFEDTSSPNILSNINPSLMSNVLKTLPNHLKSLALSKSSFVREDLFTPDASRSEAAVAPIWDPDNMEKLMLLFGNIVTVEYLHSFVMAEHESFETGTIEKVKTSDTLMHAPRWRRLTAEVIDNIERGNNEYSLLCRLRRYKNKQLGIGYDKLDLPIIDEYFLMVVDPDKKPVLGVFPPPPTAWINVAEIDTDGDHLHTIDIDGFDDDLPEFKLVDFEGDQILVKEFEGSVATGDCATDGTGNIIEEDT